jgi:hypothetical protein
MVSRRTGFNGRSRLPPKAQPRYQVYEKPGFNFSGEPRWRERSRQICT